MKRLDKVRDLELDARLITFTKMVNEGVECPFQTKVTKGMSHGFVLFKIKPFVQMTHGCEKLRIELTNERGRTPDPRTL